MSFYEINLLVSTMLSQEEAITALTGIESKVEKYGKAISEKIIEKKKLAYSIQKETEAWLIYFNFSPVEGFAKKEALDAVEKALKAEKNIIRYLIVKKEEPKPIKERPNRKNTENSEEESVKSEGTENTKEVKDIKEIENKIEEIEEGNSSSIETKKKVQLEELDELLEQE